MDILKEFHGPNAGYIIELYERYLDDPTSVDAATSAAFGQLDPRQIDRVLEGHAPQASSNGATPAAAPLRLSAGYEKTMGVVRYAQAIRDYGHLGANLDPLGSEPYGDPHLVPEQHDITEELLHSMPADLVAGPCVFGATSAWDAMQNLRTVYMESIGYDYAHLTDPDERQWLRDAAESRRFHPNLNGEQRIAMLERLTEIEGFEKFLHHTFQGKTRFSIEGLDTMVPILDEILDEASDSGIKMIVMGMAHRGRLNVLAHILQKPYEQLLAEFKDPDRSSLGSRMALGWLGDVKYHEGARRRIETGRMRELSVVMAPNPSHLEHVNPVVEGMVRAADSIVDHRGETSFDHPSAMALLIHGDSAFPGQGIVAETLNFADISGWRTGGTIHIIANNQLGFTTPSVAGRSTLYASDLAKGFKIPIVHVNADDPEACLEVAALAYAYRNTFNRDFLIDLVGYRRYGHNEGDEPRFTQPLMYANMDEHPTVRQIWGAKLVAEGLLPAGKPAEMLEEHLEKIRTIYDDLKPLEALPEPEIDLPPAGVAGKVDTTVAIDLLKEFSDALLTFPADFTINQRIQRVMDRRAKAVAAPKERKIDWGTAESLAFASILAQGTAIRLTGEDAERGTFSHRHALLHDQVNGKPHVPLQQLPHAMASFEVRNSPLSENGALGFEYGYNIQAPDRLVLWEAQYGDFVNGAQAIIDEFVVSGRAKWEQTPSLVMLLPHGYEGQGPDHSTGRLERFLQLAAETNMRIVNCTTSGQYFHLLRRQAALLEVDPLPLIVMSPKSLLRHPMAASSLEELATGRWQPVIDDPLMRTKTKAKKVKRVVLCSGKVYVDIVSSKEREAADHVAIVRVEQLYPFPQHDLKETLARYPQATEFVWLQEEPANMGAWDFIQPLLTNILPKPPRYIGRPRSASPAEGSSGWHQRRQGLLIEEALEK